MKALASIFFLAFIGILVLAVTTPASFAVERAVSIDSSPSRVYSQINDLRLFTKWSPWEDKDASIDRTYSRGSVGKGAVYSWTGNSVMTEGRVEITANSSSRKVVKAFDFTRPFAIQAIPVPSVPPYEVKGTSEVEVVQRGGATVVTWTLRGKHAPLDRIKRIVGQLDNTLEREMGRGLAKLKRVVEG